MLLHSAAASWTGVTVLPECSKTALWLIPFPAFPRRPASGNRPDEACRTGPVALRQRDKLSQHLGPGVQPDRGFQITMVAAGATKSSAGAEIHGLVEKVKPLFGYVVPQCQYPR